MNNLDKQYTDLLQDILDNGVTKSDRTGTGTISVFGRQIRHKMVEGFPLLTTKKMAFKTMVTELLWFLRGDTSIKYLVDNGCHIWDGDAYKGYLNKIKLQNNWEVTLRTMDVDTIGQQELLSKEEFINKIKTDDEFARKWGELGPVYGKQWRHWENIGIDIQNTSEDRKSWSGECWNEEPIDQIANLINDLKNNPDSRRLMVSAWNVGELDQMVLPPCHYSFQVYTRELNRLERIQLGLKAGWKPKGHIENFEHEDLNGWNIPTRAISLMWNQRSVDTFLGLPFNIASYGLLLEIIAKSVNMVPDELIGNLGDVHLYSNHIEQAKEQIGRELSIMDRIDLADKKYDNFDIMDFGIPFKCTHEDIDKYYPVPTQTREPFPLPTLEIKAAIGLYDFFEYLHVADISDFEIKNYQSHPTIKAPLSN